MQRAIAIQAAINMMLPNNIGQPTRNAVGTGNVNILAGKQERVAARSACEQ
jgi:hypothetical protein